MIAPEALDLHSFRRSTCQYVSIWSKERPEAPRHRIHLGGRGRSCGRSRHSAYTSFSCTLKRFPDNSLSLLLTPWVQRYNLPRARPLNPREQKQVDLYRALRERFHDGPYYSVLQSSSVTARKDEATRAHFDPFHGMPTYSGKYQKQKRDRPELKGRPYGKCCVSEG